MAEYRDFSAGIVNDALPAMIPPTAIWAGQDIILKDDGSLTKRGGFTQALTAGVTFQPEHIAILDSSELDNITEGILYDERTGGAGAPVQVAAFAPSSSNFALSSVLSLAMAGVINGGPGWATPAVNPPSNNLPGGGRPARYFNRILRPNGIPASIAASHEYRPFSIYGGATFAKTTARTGTATITLTQNDPILTGFSAADTGAVEVGMIGRFSDGTHHYSGRVVAIPTSTTIQFSPAPSLGTWNTGAVQWVIAPISSGARRIGASPLCGARALTVWGDRVILGGVAYDMLNAGTKLEVKGNRLVWGILPAIDSGLVGTVTSDGIRESNLDTFLDKDFDDVMAMETIAGLEPINQGELLVLGYPRCYRVVGYFTTQTTQAGGSNTWDVRPIQDGIACISDAATATTPIGVFYAGQDGIYLYHNGKAENTLVGRRRNAYVNSLRLSTQVVGGGYLGNNHYFFSFAGGVSWLCNFDHGSFRWTDIASPNGVAMGQVCFEPSRVPAGYVTSRNAGAGSSLGKLMRIDNVFQPAAANAADAGSSSTPNCTMATRSFTEGDAGQLKILKAVEVTLRLKNTGATATVDVVAGLNRDEGVTNLGTIAGDASGLTRMVRFSVPSRLKSRAFDVRISITPNATADEFQLLAVTLDTAPLNPQRSA